MPYAPCHSSVVIPVCSSHFLLRNDPHKPFFTLKRQKEDLFNNQSIYFPRLAKELHWGIRCQLHIIKKEDMHHQNQGQFFKWRTVLIKLGHIRLLAHVWCQEGMPGKRHGLSLAGHMDEEETEDSSKCMFTCCKGKCLSLWDPRRRTRTRRSQ